PYEESFGENSDLFDAVMSLPEKERIPLHLFYYEGCSTAEIAKLLKMKESTVRVRMMRGREKLKKILKEESV
ncbi:MAG: sigma-70 family RNA polymerase sigma factor, partial [Oscillospiraceae bacterium]|nr:sigma-70 family RNA polymerase sigma factor [Oscillospiraceae bacterium]